ncbi:MAG: SH3 domain-containing protein [Lachnospiraceae bacterium]|nr:SH3 domain-containing protein [Lachnospiraceae bacterium]
MERSRKRRKNNKYYMIGAAILLVLIVIGIVIGVNSCGRKEEEDIADPVVQEETESEEETLSPEEIAAEEEKAEREAHEELIEDTIASYGDIGMCSLEDGGYLNIREAADQHSDIVGKLYDRSACSVREDQGDWLKIKSGEIEGFVKSQYIITGEDAVQLARDEFKLRAIVLTERLNIRTEPSKESDVIGTAEEGGRYEVEEELDEWVKLKKGYVSKEYVELKECLDEARKLDEKTAVLNMYDNLGVSNVDNYLNIRKGPGDNQDIIGKLPKNSGAEILDEENGWYKIRSGAVTGYVSSKYILTGSAAVGIAIDKAELMAIVEADALNVREGPGEEYKAWTQITNSERYPVLGEENGWVKIDLGDDDDESGEATTAFVSSDFVEVRYALNEAIKFSPTEIARMKASSKRGQICNYALQFIGNPYVWGGLSLTKGCDCSGFVLKVMQKFGINLPHYSGAQAKSGKKVDSGSIRPGDLVFYANKSGTINHVAIYIGNGQIVHAANKKSGIKISSWRYRSPVKIVNVIGD